MERFKLQYNYEELTVSEIVERLGELAKYKQKLGNGTLAEVVRCKDCKYGNDTLMGGWWCENPDKIMPLGCSANSFCSCGERKERL